MNLKADSSDQDNTVADLIKELSRLDLINILEITTRSLQCHDQTDYFRLVESASDLFSFKSAHSVVVPRGDENRKTPQMSLMDVSFPQGYFDYYFSQNFHLEDKVIRTLLQTFDIQNHIEVHKKYDNSVITKDDFEWGLPDGFSHITHDQDFGTVTICSFAGKYIENVGRTRAIVKYLQPHFSEAHKRVIGHAGHKSLVSRHKLTGREVETLQWLKEGKSSWEISAILGISERTTNFHIENIKEKLNAGNRTHAVAIALSEGIISV